MSFETELISNGNPVEAIVGFSRAVRVGVFYCPGGAAKWDVNNPGGPFRQA